MARRSKIRPFQVRVESSQIKPTKVRDIKRVSFNFRRLRSKGEKFKFQTCESKYFLTLLDRLHLVSNMTRTEMTVQNWRGLGCHTIDFKDKKVTEDSFGNLGEDIMEQAWQFKLTANEYGRIHGYFIENIFYVVWLDPRHELCP